jgi:hypothetical protein
MPSFSTPLQIGFVVLSLLTPSLQTLLTSAAGRRLEPHLLSISFELLTYRYPEHKPSAVIEPASYYSLHFIPQSQQEPQS